MRACGIIRVAVLGRKHGSILTVYINPERFGRLSVLQALIRVVITSRSRYSSVRRRYAGDRTALGSYVQRQGGFGDQYIDVDVEVHRVIFENVLALEKAYRHGRTGDHCGGAHGIVRAFRH